MDLTSVSFRGWYSPFLNFGNSLRLQLGVYSYWFICFMVFESLRGTPGPTAAQVGASWSCLAEVGPKAIQMDSKLKPSHAHGHPRQF